MTMTIAKRLDAVKPSPTLAVAARATQLRAQGLDVINLGVGEPDFDTPEPIKAAGIKAIQAGLTKYTPVDGIMPLKKAIQTKFLEDNQLGYALNQIMVSTGGKQCLYNLCQALINEGDEVIIPAPFWVSYPDMVLLAGGKPVFIPTTADHRYKITADQLSQVLTQRSKLLILNSPSNPTGVAYTQAELKKLGEVLAAYPDLLIVSDDLYEEILWTKPFTNIAMACPALKDRVIVVNGVSKAYAMTGWRIGYAAGPAPLIEAMTTIQSQSTSNPCSIAQHAALAALTGDKTAVVQMVHAFKERHDFLVNALKQIPLIDVLKADGTFYLFPSIAAVLAQKGIDSDLVFANQLLEQEGLAVVPGSAFGVNGTIRLSFATSMTQLEQAVQRLKRFCFDL